MTDDVKEVELILEVIQEIVGTSPPNIPGEVAAAVYREFMQPLVERAEAAENRLKSLDARRGEAPELHETVPPGPHRGGEAPELLCSCGRESKTTLALYIHQVGALRRELQILADLVPVLSGEVDRVAAVAVATRAEVVDAQIIVDEHEAMLTRVGEQLIEAGSRIRELEADNARLLDLNTRAGLLVADTKEELRAAQDELRELLGHKDPDHEVNDRLLHRQRED